MPYRIVPFENQHFYHVFNRGVEKRRIFSDEFDYDRFLNSIYYYQFDGPKPRYSTHKRFKNKDFNSHKKIVEITSYCLMPNHFHFLLRQLKNNGLQEFVGKLINSYTKYFNTKNKRVGPLFQGTFKAVHIETDEQLLHISRYIHLNPFVSGLTDDITMFSYSSYQDFLGTSLNPLCNIEPIVSFFRVNSTNTYEQFVTDYQSYALELEKIKHLLIDEE